MKSYQIWKKLSYGCIALIFIMSEVKLKQLALLFVILWITCHLIYVLIRRKTDPIYNEIRTVIGIKVRTFDYALLMIIATPVIIIPLLIFAIALAK
ncbi:Hypothetical protein LUCI_3436 [Lucifera butyrica]|uniref:Uncharacterized protein n=1 Tax=Lucifera butyrica TaxID=1351585 RepID=A0A498R9W3_9FIRM|nr:hypothetical protein [Lucifera butyrica]VBB08171.1 Hypothetical protein LUCI_3436 [Lucifera butyrica]